MALAYNCEFLSLEILNRDTNHTFTSCWIRTRAVLRARYGTFQFNDDIVFNLLSLRISL